MASITSAGIGSGLDIEGIITKLMALEKRPLAALDKQESSYQAKISALGSLKSSISALQTAAAALVPAAGRNAQTHFATYSSTLADTTVGTATADSSASSAVGDYSLRVIQTARAARVVFAASPALTAGTLTIDAGGGSFSVSVTDGMALSALRTAINDAAGGVTATLVGGGTQLMLTRDTGGAATQITISGDTGVGLAQTSNTPGQDAQIEFAGIPLTSTTNTFTDVVDGVDFKLSSSAAANTTTTLSVTADTLTRTSETINAFVKAHNDYVAQAKKLGFYDASTKTAGTLQGDYTLRTTQSRIHGLVTATPTGITGAVKVLSDLGVSIQSDGTLAVDSTRLTATANGHYEDLTAYLAAFGNSIKSATDAMLASDGTITGATDSISNKIKSLDKRRDALEYRLTQIEARYRRQFTALDSMVASMTTTSSYLTQQLDNLPWSNLNKSK